MLKTLWHHRRDLFALLCALLAAWWLLAGANYIGNENHAHHYNANEQDTLFLIGFGRPPIVAAEEIWSFIDTYHDVIFGAITALATIAVAIFTATIWQINRSHLSHSHQVERAYISGGGEPFLERNERFEELFSISGGGPTQRVIETTPTGKFVLRINNYGKTAAELLGFAVEFCDAKNIPQNPVYSRQYWYDWILPGDRGRPVKLVDIPTDRPATAVYGRFYYRDIFGKSHSCGFINKINRETGESVPVEAQRAYTDEQDEPCT
jgi:hypothetical protein